MSDTLIGSNEAEVRLRKMVGQTNNGRIDYPSATNDRGSGGREHHAGGDRVGGDMSAPGRGGMRQRPNFGKPLNGREEGTRRKAVSEARGESHAHGDRVGRSRHADGDMVPQAQEMSSGGKACKKMGGRMDEPRPMYRRGGRSRPMED